MNLEEERTNRKENARVIEGTKVVNGLQLKFEFEKIEASTNLQQINFENYKFNRIENNKEINRGSPP